MTDRTFTWAMRFAIGALLLFIAASYPASAMPRTTNEADLRQFIEDMRSCRYDANAVTSGVASMIDRQCEKAKKWLDGLGDLVEIRFIATNDKRRADLYLVIFERKWTVWQLGRDARNRIRHFRGRGL